MNAESNEVLCLRTSHKASLEGNSASSTLRVPITTSKRSLANKLLTVRFIICHLQDGSAWSIARPFKVEDHPSGSVFVHLTIVMRFGSRLRVTEGGGRIQQPLSMINAEDLSPTLREALKELRVSDVSNLRGSLRGSAVPKTRREKSEIGLAEGIAAGGFTSFLSSLLLFLTTQPVTDLAWHTWIRLVATLVIGLYYTLTYYREMKSVSVEELVSMGVIDYLAIGAMYLTINFSMLQSPHPSRFSFLFCALILIDVVFVSLILQKHTGFLEENAATLCIYRWWLVSDYCFLLLFLSFSILSLVAGVAGSLLVVVGYLGIFSLDEYANNTLKVFVFR